MSFRRHMFITKYHILEKKRGYSDTFSLAHCTLHIAQHGTPQWKSVWNKWIVCRVILTRLRFDSIAHMHTSNAYAGHVHLGRAFDVLLTILLVSWLLL